MNPHLTAYERSQHLRVAMVVDVAVRVQRGTTCARTPGRSSNAADESIVITILAVAAAVAAIIRSYAPRVFPRTVDLALPSCRGDLT